jgi:transcription initiation factor TFIIIB Brf1 subunit/transcription initiation factor TFIIB
LDDLKAALSSYRKEFKSLPSLQGKAFEKIQSRFEALIKDLKQAISSQENKQHLLEWKEVQRKAKLCRTLHHNATQADSNLDDEFTSQIELPKAIEETLKTLWISVKAGSVSKDRCVDFQTARSLCIACEIAAGIESPESDKELRMQLQVSRLSEGMSSSGENQTREQQLNETLQKWYDSVGPSDEEFEQLEPRIEKAIQHLFV